MAKLLQTSAFGLALATGALGFACSSDTEEPSGTATNTSGANSATATNTTGASTVSASSGGSGSSTTGASTTGGSTSAGVLIDGVCTLVCADDSTDADESGVTDGWGFEMGTSCVVPGGMADTGMTCDDPELAMPPDNPSTPGSGVLVGGNCTRVCDDASTDADADGVTDGWGYEFGASCIVPGGVADPGAGEACTDFEMPMSSDPGGMVEVDGTCVLVCLDDSTDADENGMTDGWGYDEEAMESCIVPGGPADTGTACT